MLTIPENDISIGCLFCDDLACGSHGDCGVLILSTFLAFKFLSLMNNYHVILYVFQFFNTIQYLQRAFPIGVENHGIKVSIRKKLLQILLVLLVFLME